jgi:polyisoprenoid-binding protein YceI
LSRLATVTAIALLAGVAMSAPSLAQAPAGAPPAAQAPPAPISKDPATLAAGTYNIDLNHSSVIARIGHGRGISYSTLRFGVTKAVLTWDTNPANIKLEATIDTKPHYDPIVYRGPPEGENFLNVAKFPSATYVSTSVTRTGPSKADVQGNLTLLGVTKPVTLHIELLGATRTNQGAPIAGFTGTAELKRSDFGNTAFGGNVGDLVTLQLDGEFLKAN